MLTYKDQKPMTPLAQSMSLPPRQVGTHLIANRDKLPDVKLNQSFVSNEQMS